MEFMTFWTHTYSPTKITYIITSVNVTYFYASSVTVFLYFLKTNNDSGYITTPVMTEEFYNNNFYACPPTNILRHIIQHVLHFTYTSPTYSQTSFIKILLNNDVPTSI